MENKLSSPKDNALSQYQHRLTETHFRCLSENVSDIIFLLDISTHKIIYANHDSFLSYSLNELLNSPLFVEGNIHPDDINSFREYITHLIVNQKSAINFRFKDKTGLWEWLHCEGLLITSDPDDSMPMEAHIISVKTGQRRIEALERDRTHALEMAARDWPIESIFNHLIQSISRHVEGSFPALLIQNENGLHHSAVFTGLSERFVYSLNNLLQNGSYGLWHAVLRQKQSVWCSNVRLEAEWGEYSPALSQEGISSAYLIPVLSGDGTGIGVITLYFKQPYPIQQPWVKELCESFSNIISLVIERRRFTDLLFHQAMYDSLTNLPNRNLLEENLNQILFHARRKNQIIALVFIQLDNYDNIKEMLGYYIGEELLKLVAERLVHFMGSATRTAHLTEDTFVIVLTDLPHYSNAVDLIRQVTTLLKPSFRVGNNDLYLEVSTGYSAFPRDGDNVIELIKNAEMALAFPIIEGSEKIVGFEPQMDTIAHEKLRVTTQLRAATEQSQFALFYQPQIDMKRGCIIGFECLIRWKHSDFGFVTPITFIPLAEDTGLIVPIGDWVLNEACRQLAEWKSQSYPEMRVAINVSPVQFIHSDFMVKLTRALDTYHLSPKNLAIEITEGVFMRDTENVARKLSKIRDMGIEIHIDDFGTAYSSLSYLRKLPVDCLKIDKSFIDAMLDTDEKQIDTTALPRAIVTLGHGLKLTVLAEGVESIEQVHLLNDMGCDQAQGYLFSRPLPADQVWPAVEKINATWKNIRSGQPILKLS
jgi:diguanylate cyclase (GGDEF)-like protein